MQSTNTHSLAASLAVVLCAMSAIFASTAISAAAEPKRIHFNRDVRPILADKCFRCHGRDASARQAELRLDTREHATANRGDSQAIVPRKPAASELIRRITATDDERMPPGDSGLVLDDIEIDILRRWIDEGAVYEPHWSFIAPRRPAPPNVRGRDWPSNPIDVFVLARLEREGLEPSPPAGAGTLLRRVTLDLTGLPPTLEELADFERDSIRDPAAAYARCVDRLLASPRFGERMAQGWLDAARYADTNGYFTDNDRTMWRWRDWVIGAFNDNMAFDQFTIEQLAGDLLPRANVEQKIATGFNRNHMVNNETGIVEEEFRVEYVVDRVDTTATVWMGLTLGCARCHDHKYDPVSQREFYEFFSFFNNVPERGLSGSRGNARPILSVPTADQQAQMAELKRSVAAAERRFAAVKEKLDTDQAAWEKTAAQRTALPPARGLTAHYTLEPDASLAWKVGKVDFVAGMVGQAAKFNGNASLRVPDGIEFERTDAFSYGGWVYAQSAGCVISKIDDANDLRGFDLTLRKGKAVVNLVHRWNRDAIQVSTVGSVANGQWQHLMVTYDGSSKAAGVRVYLDGKRQPVVIGQDRLTGTIRNRQPLRIGRRQASASLKGMIDDVRIYDGRLSDDEVLQLAAGQLVRGILATPAAKRSTAQNARLRAYFLSHHADESQADAAAELEAFRAQQRGLANRLPTTMVMQELDKPRKAFVLVRGQYDQPGEEVTAGVPAFLSAATNRPANRLDLARWLVAPTHALTARVTVNRWWEQLFGTGIVSTVDDFGTQGEWPSHPELLDWLATEYVASGWDTKRLLRLLVTSSTYRQSSRISPELLHRDRENRLLARGPRFRMDAEMLRDNALALSGLAVEKLGGPSVKPYQPAGLWQDVTYDGDLAYRPDRAESLYRRSLYTYWKRQAPPPAMLAFDAPTRETCTVSRTRTNTPLQALVLMNDPTFVEAARKLAERAMVEAGGATANRIDFAFRAATARSPTADERKVLLGVLEEQRGIYRRDVERAQRLVEVGESAWNRSLNRGELAAWTVVTSMILCLDETITKR